MKILLIALFTLGSISAQAKERELASCKLQSMKITVKEKRDSDLNILSQTVIFSKKGKKQKPEPLVEVRPIGRTLMEKDAYLIALLKKLNLKPINVLSGTAYITDSNNEGEAGLVVFKASRGEVVGKIWFVSYANYTEVCK